MVATKVPRLSSGVRFLGYTLLVPCLFILITSAACGILFTGASCAAVVEMTEDMRQRGTAQLRDIDDLPLAIIEDFAEDGAIDEAVLRTLPESQRQMVDIILRLYTPGLA